MEEDSDLEDYNITQGESGILPRTPAEQALMVDNDQDMNSFEVEANITEQTLSIRSAMEEKMIEEGLRLRQLICRDAVQTHKPISMQASSRSLTEILQLIPEEDAGQVSEFQGQVYMPQHFLEKYLLPTMQLRRTLDQEGEDIDEEFDSLPGGQETAMMYSIFRHAKDTSTVEDGNKLRSLIAHANEQTPQQVVQIRENMVAKTTYLETFVQQLRDAVRLPSARTMYTMTAEEIIDKNRLVNEILENFEEQLKKDYKSFERARQQNVLITRLNYEQQLHIHDLNLESFNVASQRQELLDKALGLDVQMKVSQVKDTLKDLQDQLAQQCQSLTEALNPMDTSTVMETLTRLRDALKDATYQNAYLVMKNNELTLENSFMTPTQLAVITKIKAEQSPQYMNQRTDPHCIVRTNTGGQPMYKKIDLPPQHCSILPSNEDLFREVEEVLQTKGKKRENPSPESLPPSATTGKGKRKEGHTPRPGDIKHPRFEGSNTAETVIAPNPKGNTFSGSKGKSKGKFLGWRHPPREPSNVPVLTTSGPQIKFFYMEDLEQPGSEVSSHKLIAYKLPTSNRYMNQPMTSPPSDNWITPRIEGKVNSNHREIYHHALECMRLAIQSPYERLIQDRYTGGWLDCEGIFVPLPEERNKYPYWYYLPNESNKLGDFIKVLRVRPCKPGAIPDFEYLPNSTYSFAMVKTILKDSTNVRVKPSRFWNELRVQGVANKILYTLHDYCPGMPVNLEQECKNMNLHPYVATEIVLFPPNDKEKFPIDAPASVAKMVSLGILKDPSDETIEQFLTDLQPTIERFNHLDDTWPFALARLFINAHMFRLERMKYALKGYLESRAPAIDQGLNTAPAQSGGQDGAPNWDSQEQSRQDLSRGGSSQ